MILKKEQLAKEFIGVGRAYKLSFSKANLKYDCSLKDMRIIELLATGPKTMSELAKEIQLTPGTMTTAVDKLIESKHVKRVHDIIDRRKITIELLQKGKKVADTIHSLSLDISSRMLEALNEKEQDQLILALSKINKHLENQLFK